MLLQLLRANQLFVLRNWIFQQLDFLHIYNLLSNIIDTASSPVNLTGSWSRLKPMSTHPVLLLACILVWYYLCKKLVSLGDSVRQTPMTTRLLPAGVWVILAVQMQLVPCKARQQASAEKTQRPQHQAGFVWQHQNQQWDSTPPLVYSQGVSKNTGRILLLKVCSGTKT